MSPFPSQTIPKGSFLSCSASPLSCLSALVSMTAPNIEMIAALLRSCTVGRERGLRSPEAYFVGGSQESVSVELNSETALPFHWEQCLDMQTGEVYYFNRETGTRTSKDPRSAAASAYAYSSSYHSEEDVSSDDGESFSGVTSGSSKNDNEDSSDSTANSCLTSISSSSSSSPSRATAAEPLVSAGCRSCFMYFMVPKSDDACPKCDGRLFKLGRHGNA